MTYSVPESTVLCLANHYEILTMYGLFSVLILKTIFLSAPYRAGQNYPIGGPHPPEHPVTSCGAHGRRKKERPVYLCKVHFTTHSAAEDMFTE